MAPSRFPVRPLALAAALAAALALGAGPAAAQPSEAARAYAEASGFADAAAAVVPDIVAQEEAGLRQALPEADEAAVAAYLGFFAEELEARLPALEARAAELADAIFAPEELREITAFLETEIGRVFVEGNVRAQQELFALVQAWAASSGEEAALRAEERLAEQGLEL